MNTEGLSKCGCCQNVGSCAVCNFIEEFCGKESRTTEQLRILSEHIASIAVELHKSNSEIAAQKNTISQLYSKIAEQHQQLCEMDAVVGQKDNAWRMTADRYAKTLDWIRELCGGLSDEAIITAEDAKADTPTSMEIIDSLESILHNYVVGKGSEIEVLQAHWETKARELQQALATRDSRILDLERIVNGPAKRIRPRKVFTTKSPAAKKCEEVKTERIDGLAGEI